MIPATASACPFCAGNFQGLKAYIGPTLLLILLPLTLISAIGIWFHRSVKNN